MRCARGWRRRCSATRAFCLFGLDVDDHKAIQGSTRGLVEEFGPERVFGTPLSEDAMTGVAIGAAMAGMRPVHVHIRMDFLMLAMNQLDQYRRQGRYMYDGQVKVPMVVRSMIGKSWGQGAQHSQGLHAMFMHVPGLKVVAPSNAYDAKGCLIAAIRDDNPVIFVEHRLLYFTDAFVPEETFVVPFGKARVCTARRRRHRSSAFPTCWWKPARTRNARRHRHPGRGHRSDHAGAAGHRHHRRIGAAHRTASGRRQCLDELRRQRRNRRPRRRARENGKPIAVQRMGYAPTTCPTTPVLEQEFYPDPGKIAQAAHAMVRPGRKSLGAGSRARKLAYQSNFAARSKRLPASAGTNMFYELAASTWGAEEIDAIQRVIASDRFTIGPNVAAFEQAFAAYHGCKYAVMVNSGSSANLIAVAALFYKKDRPLQRGDEVIVPAISWATTYHPLQQYGLKLKIVDVELDTINMDTAQLEARDRAAHPRHRRREHSRQSRGARRHAALCRRARPLFPRGQLRIDRCRAGRPQSRHFRPYRRSARSSPITSRRWKAAW